MFTRTMLLCLLLFFFPLILLGQVAFDPPLQRNQPIQFPDTPVGQQSVIALSATNVSNGQIRVNFNQPNQPFSIDPRQVILAPNEVGFFSFIFTPQQVGAAQSQFVGSVFLENGMGMRLGPFTLAGTGIEENEPQPEIVIEPEEFQIAIEEDTGAIEEILTIGNVGDEALVGELDVPDVEWFSVEPDEFRIAEGEELEVTLTFGDDWPDNGDYDIALPILSNDPENDVIEVPIEVSIDIPRYVDRVIELRSGWSIISSNVDFAPDFVDDEGPDMQLILNDIVEQILIIKNGAGRFCAPPFNFWGLSQWNTPDGYLIKMSEDAELSIRGLPIPFNRRIELESGWSMIAFYPTYDLEFGRALEELVERDQLIIAKNQNGQFYSPQFNFGWDIFITPTEGIMVKVTEDCSFEYPPEPE